jgi:hypothetical protein
MYDNLCIVTREFKRKAKELAHDQAWILRAENSQHEEWQKLLERLDAIVAQMPDTERRKFAQRLGKIIPNNATQFNDEYDEQFLDALVELLGYGFLKFKYPSGKVCYEEPDWIVLDDKENLVAAMACKAIRTSKEHDDYVKHHQGEPWSVDHRLASTNRRENPLLRKIESKLSEGEQQLAKRNAPNKFIYIDFAWDPSAQSQKSEVNNLVKKLGEELSTRSINLIAIENFQFNKPFICI